MSADATNVEDLLLAIRNHPIHEGPVQVQVGLHGEAKNVAPWRVVVFGESGNTVAEVTQASLLLAASNLVRQFNAERDAKVLELRRQVAKLTGNPEVAA